MKFELVVPACFFRKFHEGLSSRSVRETVGEHRPIVEADERIQMGRHD
jgi:hypothetical protein